MSEFRFKLEANCDSRFEIVFSSDFPQLTKLRMNPEHVEDALLVGTWLVLAVTVWDPRDRPVVNLACEFSKLIENARVAIRPFEFGYEFRNWVPTFENNAGDLVIKDEAGNISISTLSENHPVWFVFDEGKLISTLTGVRDRALTCDYLKEQKLLS